MAPVLVVLLWTPIVAPGQAPPATQPAGEVVRVVRSAAVEGGRSPQELANPEAVLQNPVWQSWRGWGVGTRIILRTDEVDALGRNRPVARRMIGLHRLTGEGLELWHWTVQPDGRLGEPVSMFVPAQLPRRAVVVQVRGAPMVYWRRLDARVAFEVPVTAPTAFAGPTNRRRGDVTGRAPHEALPAQFDATVLESAYLDEGVIEEGEPLPDDVLIVWRSYNNLTAPGWETVLEYYRGRLDEHGRAADLQLVTRTRLERVLRPGEPDPTAEDLRAGLPAGS